MVYCGRPSTGCGTCKRRRIKCDEERPECKNCVKTNRECPGYPAEVDLLFRKEDPGRRKSKSNDVEASSKKRSNNELDWTAETGGAAKRKRRRRESDTVVQGYKSLQWVDVNALRSNSVPDISECREQSPLLNEQPLNPPDNLVLPPKYDTSTNFLDIAAPLIENAKHGPPLCLAAEAVSAAAMAKSSCSQELSRDAAHCYGKALAAAQEVMQDPAHATSDETLLTILLFALYESITPSEHSAIALMKHVEGAGAIMSTRISDNIQHASLLSGAVHTQMPKNTIPPCDGTEISLHLKSMLLSLFDNRTTPLSIPNTSLIKLDPIDGACLAASQPHDLDMNTYARALIKVALDEYTNLSTQDCYMVVNGTESSSMVTSTSCFQRRWLEANMLKVASGYGAGILQYLEQQLFNQAEYKTTPPCRGQHSSEEWPSKLDDHGTYDGTGSLAYNDECIPTHGPPPLEMFGSMIDQCCDLNIDPAFLMSGMQETMDDNSKAASMKEHPRFEL